MLVIEAHYPGDQSVRSRIVPKRIRDAGKTPRPGDVIYMKADKRTFSQTLNAGHVVQVRVHSVDCYGHVIAQIIKK